MCQNAVVVTTMLGFFRSDPSKTNFILNVLLLTDIAVWKPAFLEELLAAIGEFAQDGSVSLLLSYNPLMSIALACDLLTKIGESRKMFRDACREQKDTLLELGDFYI